VQLRRTLEEEMGEEHGRAAEEAAAQGVCWAPRGAGSGSPSSWQA
jgi:hypothetical protein